MKETVYRSLALALCTICICALRAPAQGAGPSAAPPPGFDEERELTRKQPGFLLRRPKMENPEQQMAWAHELVAGGKKNKARRAFDALVHRWHGSLEAPEAQMMVAGLLYERGKLDEAFDEFQYSTQFFSGRVDHEKVVACQFDIACRVMNSRSMTLGFFPGMPTTEKAIPLFKNIVENAPSGSHAAHAQFLIGFIYEDLGEYGDALDAYEQVHESYRKSLFAEEASFRKAICISRLSRKARHDERLCRSTQMAVGRFISEYPASEFGPEAEELYQETEARLAEMYFQRAVFYDKKASNAKAAIIVYSDFLKRFPEDSRAEQARERITILEAELEEMNENE